MANSPCTFLKIESKSCTHETQTWALYCTTINPHHRKWEFSSFLQGLLLSQVPVRVKIVIHEHADRHSKKDDAEKAASSTTRTAVASWNLGWLAIPPKSMDTTLKMGLHINTITKPLQNCRLIFLISSTESFRNENRLRQKVLHPAGLSQTRQIEPWQLPNLATPFKNPGKKLRNQQTGVTTLISTFDGTLRASVWPVLWQVAWWQWRILDFFACEILRLLTQQMAVEPSSNQSG